MANPEHLEILKQGVKVWNEWRVEHPLVTPDLIGEAFGMMDLSEINLSQANLTYTQMIDVMLTGANLSKADLHFTNFTGSILIDVDISSAKIMGTDFTAADLSRANMSDASLFHTKLMGTKLIEADLTDAKVFLSSFDRIDLSSAKGLETIKHIAPSALDIETIYKSKGNIPEVFLRGCGVPEDFITYIHSLTVQPIQFYSCFISYSHKDEDFARRLYSRMRDANLRVWYAPEEMKGGQKLHEQIFDAIHLHDKLLLVLSEHSLQSEWVMTEIRRARKAEREENRRKLFPIKLVDFDAIQKWECFDADSGKDLVVEMREYFIPDFSNWKDHYSFEKAFDRLLRDLKAEDKQAAEHG